MENILHHFFDEKSIYWQDDLDHVSSMIIKTLKSFKEDSKFTLMPLWKEDEKQFALNLLSKAITNKEHNDKVLQSYSKNWESERLAKMDSLLMNLAVTEAKEFSSIPLKVTLNEYIEISKFYSTPKSNGFINGILDKIFIDAGFDWREPGCSMCLAMNPDQLKPKERCASTSNRNFEGRQGREGRTHLVSPVVAAASAIKGTFAQESDL